MSTKYKSDLDLLREMFAVKGTKGGKNSDTVYKEYHDKMSAKDSKAVVKSIQNAEKSPIQSYSNAVDKGIVKMYRNAGIARGMSDDQLKVGAKAEGKYLREGMVHPAIKEKTEEILKMGGKIDRLSTENASLKNQLSDMKGKFKDVSGKLNNLVSNLISKEGMTQSKIDSYSKTAAPSMDKGMSKQISEGKSR